MKIRIMPYGTVNFIQHEVPYAVRAVSEIMGYSTYRVFFSKRFPTLLSVLVQWAGFTIFIPMDRRWLPTWPDNRSVE